MGIEHYLPRALAAYDTQAARATQAATQRAAADERPQREQYQTWEQHELDQRRAALPPAELAAREAAARARLVAEGTPAVRCRWRCGWRSTRCSRRRPGCRPSRPGGTRRRHADEARNV